MLNLYCLGFRLARSFLAVLFDNLPDLEQVCIHL